MYMKIYIRGLALDQGNLSKIGDKISSIQRTTVDLDRFIRYPVSMNNRKMAFETGFFNAARHLDRRLFAESSLNKKNIRKFVYELKYPLDVTNLYENEIVMPKYLPKEKISVDWKGFVLISQSPRDYSILSVNSKQSYFEFVENCCKYFGKSLFIKKHPRYVNRKEVLGTTEGMEETYDEFLSRMCKKYGCEAEHVQPSIINNAEGIISYNSTFCVDAALKGKTVMQYAPGYFYKTGFVHYTEQKICSKTIEIDSEYRKTFLNFLFWKYCFCIDSEPEWLYNIFVKFGTSKKEFPLPMKYSYGAHVLKTLSKSIDELSDEV